ncbi:glycosyltransferase [Aquabacterium sp.]|uniref:glycosyltransferase n=1 Tax=Aquabacterium sp. TaxID=1872578 RepID=UPI002486D2C3|nr:glycosyltransferase [Aquabacterium sp.]MDI1349101.1 glycosyltransferase [Aquabacterium sp.]
MRLALLSPLPPEQTGIADYAAHCRAALNQAGVDVLTPLQGQRPITSLATAKAWVAERDWRRIDVVHAELGGGRHSEFLTLCALASLPNRPALSVTVHDPERLIWKPVNGLWRAVNASSLLPRAAKQAVALLSDPVTLMSERALARKLDGVVALTQTGADRLAKRMKLAPGRVSVIPHGVLSLPQRPLPDLHDALGEVAIKVLYFGFIYSGKGIEDLIDAVGRLRNEAPEVAGRIQVTIAGGTAPDIAFGGQGSYLDQLRERAAKRGLAGQVTWELDIDEHDIADLIQRHHVMVLPYRESAKLALLGQMRGTSGALAWAIGCGRGAITSDARAFAEEISHGNGAAYRQGDVPALAMRLREVVEQPELLLQWAKQASLLAQARAWPTTGQRFLGHFQRVVARAEQVRGARAQVGGDSGWARKESL